ncbi:MAG: GmrSD restriction endonuclease domain-containing protein [Candidatus Woesearchaeota archaeon]
MTHDETVVKTPKLNYAVQEERSIDIDDESLSEFIPKKMTEEGKYKYSYTIPKFQREFVWEYSDLKDLWDSIYRHYPIGSLMIWESEECLPDNRQIAENIFLCRTGGNTYKYILDGQQRITSLVVSIFNGLKKKSNRKNPMDLTLYISLENALTESKLISFDEKKKIKLFFSKNDIKKFTPQQEKYLVEVSKLVYFDTDIYEAFFEKEREIAQLYKKITDRISKYKLPIITLRNMPREEVSELFTRVNTKGQKLSTIDLLTAYTYKEDFYLKGEKYLEGLFGESGKLDKINFSDLDELLFIRLISMMIKGECKESDLFEIKSEDFKKNWDKGSDAIIEAIDFLKKLNITSPIIVPYSPMIVSLSYFFYLLREKGLGLSDEVNVAITKWFWIKSFNGDYQGATNEEIKNDCSAFKKYIEKSGKFEYDTDKKAYSSEKIIAEKMNLSSGFCKTILCLMANLHPRDFTNHNVINIYDVLVEYKKNEYHHIFPKRSDAVAKFSDDKINSVANICFLPKKSNSHISNDNPSEYFIHKVKEKNVHYLEDLNTNIIPHHKESGIWVDDFETFLNNRAQKIYEILQKLIE